MPSRPIASCYRAHTHAATAHRCTIADVPSFMLDRLATPNDAIKFFETPALPYGVREGQKPFLFDLDESSLPPNLSIDLPEKTKRARGAGADDE